MEHPVVLPNSTLVENTWNSASRELNYTLSDVARGLCPGNLNTDGRAKPLDGHMRGNWGSGAIGG